MPLRWASALLGALCAASACGQRTAPDAHGNGGAVASATGGAGSAPAASGVPAVARAAGEAAAVPQPLTPSSVALGNLSDHIQALERRLETQGSTLPLRAELVDYLLSRTQFLSTFSDFERAEELAEHAPEQFPGQAKAFQLRARFRAAVHRFADAEGDLARAEALGASAQETELQRASLHIAQGHELPAALQVAERRAQTLPTLERKAVQALAQAALGRFDAADEQYRAALASYQDVAPFPVAFVEFQRGVMWAELADQPERALPHYQEAVRLIPEYVVANVHLAELELARGEAPAAEQRLRQISRAAEDPEAWARLGQLLLERSPGDAEGRALLERAARRYEQLLNHQRAAFLDHAAEFFLGPGAKPALALELSRDNLLLRQTGRAYQLALQSALAANDAELFCRTASQAAGAAPGSRNLTALLAAHATRCTAATPTRR